MTLGTAPRPAHHHARSRSAANDLFPLGTLWTTTMTGGRARELASAGKGVADPVPAADGSVVTFVRMISARSAKVEVLTVRTGAVHVIAAFDVDYGELKASAVISVWQSAR